MGVPRWRGPLSVAAGFSLRKPMRGLKPAATPADSRGTPPYPKVEPDSVGVPRWRGPLSVAAGFSLRMALRRLKPAATPRESGYTLGYGGAALARSTGCSRRLQPAHGL